MSEMAKSKRSAVIASLREGKFSDFKNSQPLIDKIRKQREETFAVKCSTLIAKQQDLCVIWTRRTCDLLRKTIV